MHQYLLPFLRKGDSAIVSFWMDLMNPAHCALWRLNYKSPWLEGLAHFSTKKPNFKNDRRLFIFSKLFFLKQSRQRDCNSVERSETWQRQCKKFEFMGSFYKPPT